MTIRELMQKMRSSVRSSDPVERFAAVLLIPAELSRRLRLLTNSQVGRLLESEVCANLNLLAPELTVCDEAAERLRRAPGLAGRKRRFNSSLLDGEHIMHAVSALYRAGIPFLQLPWQMNRFTSSTFFLKDVEQARACLLEAGFRKTSRSPLLLIDGQTRRPIQLYQDRQNPQRLREQRRTPSE